MHTLLRFGSLCVAAALAACSIDAATFAPPAPPTPVCGDGDLLPTETCDDGNLVDGDGCDSNCTATACGNGVKTGVEGCDDGNTETEECPYGQVSCLVCDAACQSVSGAISFCGDGTPQASFEACDDGNTETEECLYGQESCLVCDATCQSVSGATSRCGDGIPQAGFEQCDDGNLTCGSCSADCQIAGNRPAVGLIHVVAPNLLENETFTLQDDPDRPAVTFQFTTSGTTTDPSFILIDLRGLSQTGNAVAPVTRDVINAVGDALRISATSDGTNVSLTHELVGARGNIVITETVDTGSFSVEGMAGGAGADCAAGQACRSNDDCVSNSCQANVCQ